MEYFFSSDIRDNEIILGEEESRHCIKVLRLRPGDSVQVIDGKGSEYSGSLQTVSSNRQVKVQILSHQLYSAPEYQSGFHLAIAPTKNMDRIEWLLEKSVELGLSSVSFVLCERGERHSVRTDRLYKIAVSALKQSRQYWLPDINEPLGFSDFLTKQDQNHHRYIAHCEGVPDKDFGACDLSGPCHILIGPEGDFTPGEINLAAEHGWIPVSLGHSRLRTETAGLFAAAVYRQKTLIP